MQLGFIGLGKMGRPMVERLLAAGHRVHVYNRSAGPTEELARIGAEPAASASEVSSRSEAVMTALPTVESVTSTYQLLGEIARRGQVFIDHSTVSIEVNRHCAEVVQKARCQFSGCPGLGGSEWCGIGHAHGDGRRRLGELRQNVARFSSVR